MVAQIPSSVEDSTSSVWRKFSPEVVNTANCLARIWGAGRGGQCKKAQQDGSSFCLLHGKDKWQAHGRVDGPIPEKKLAEFLKAASAPPKPVKEQKASDAVTVTPRKRSREDSSKGEALTGKVARQKKADTPVKDGPKKPVGGAFSVFVARNRDSLKQKLPEGHRITDITKQASEDWKKMTEEEKTPYHQEYEKKLAAYKEAVASAVAVAKGEVPEGFGLPGVTAEGQLNTSQDQHTSPKPEVAAGALQPTSTTGKHNLPAEVQSSSEPKKRARKQSGSSDQYDSAPRLGGYEDAVLARHGRGSTSTQRGRGGRRGASRT